MSAPTDRVMVLLTNPRPEDFDDMAAKKKTTRKRRTTRKRTTRKSPTRRKRATSRRRAPARKSRRRPTRRRKNPALDIGGTAMAAAGGVVVGGAQYFLETATELDPVAMAAIMAGVGGLGGVALGMASESLGKGVAGAGLAFAALGLAKKYITPSATPTPSEGMGAVGYRQLGAVGYSPQLGAVGAAVPSGYRVSRYARR